ncbi:MAG: IS1634 family transposase, partial [Verrucomicrobiota bacterium]|nr:IS1634 family transposase [Verrucomicrobiota bacterium]
MYFRYKQIKSTRQLQLVSSYRNAEGKPRQRIVATLGNAQLPAGEEKAIAKAVEQRLVGGGL